MLRASPLAIQNRRAAPRHRGTAAPRHRGIGHKTRFCAQIARQRPRSTYIRLRADRPQTARWRHPAPFAGAARSFLGVAGSPTLVKPNRDELMNAIGTTDVAAAAATLRQAGAGAVVISLGVDGLLALTPEGAWRASPPERVAGNPTGAGDAAVAALVRGIVTGLPWPDRLRDAVALSAAAVAAALAGSFDADHYRRHLPAVRVEALPLTTHPPEPTPERHAADRDR